MKTIDQYTDMELKAAGYDLAVQGEKIQADLRTISLELERRAKVASTPAEVVEAEEVKTENV